MQTSALLFFMITLAAIAVFLIGSAVWTFVRATKRNAPNAKKLALFSLACVVLAIASWFLNMGWNRTVLTLLLIPFVHVFIFSLTKLVAASYVDESRTMRLFSLFFCITYVLAYLFYPDGDFDGRSYFFFFSLVRNYTFVNIAQYVSYIAFFAHIVLLVLQIIQIAKLKKKRKSCEDAD